MDDPAIAYVEERIREGLHLIPPHMHDGILLYVLDGIPMGSFGNAVLANDFMDAAGRADEDNFRALGNWARFLYNYVPGNCKGSPERVRSWIGGGGLRGQNTEAAA